MKYIHFIAACCTLLCSSSAYTNLEESHPIQSDEEYVKTAIAKLDEDEQCSLCQMLSAANKRSKFEIRNEAAELYNKAENKNEFLRALFLANGEAYDILDEKANSIRNKYQHKAVWISQSGNNRTVIKNGREIRVLPAKLITAYCMQHYGPKENHPTDIQPHDTSSAIAMSPDAKANIEYLTSVFNKLKSELQEEVCTLINNYNPTAPIVVTDPEHPTESQPQFGYYRQAGNMLNAQEIRITHERLKEKDEVKVNYNKQEKNIPMAQFKEFCKQCQAHKEQPK